MTTAPVLPALNMASMRRSLWSWVSTPSDDLFLRAAITAFSDIWTRSEACTTSIGTPLASSRLSEWPISASSPTSTISNWPGISRKASAAPAATTEGPKSPPIASIPIRGTAGILRKGTGYSSRGGTISSPSYQPQLGHTPCGCLGLLQWLQALSPGALSFQWVRRFLPRELECLPFGTAMACLLVSVTRACVRAEIEIGPPSKAQPGAILPAKRRDRQLDQQGVAGVVAQGQMPPVVKQHVGIANECFLVPMGAGAGPVRERLERHPHRELERREAADAFQVGVGFDKPAHRKAIAGLLDLERSRDPSRPLGLGKAQIPRPGIHCHPAEAVTQRGEVEVEHGP